MIESWLREIEVQEERALADAVAEGRKAAAARARHNLKQARAGLTCLEASRGESMREDPGDVREAVGDRLPGEKGGAGESGGGGMLLFWCVALVLFVAVECAVLTHCWVW